MIWTCQPPEKHRFRYQTDGIRYLEASRQNPPTIEVKQNDFFSVFRFFHFDFSYQIFRTSNLDRINRSVFNLLSLQLMKIQGQKVIFTNTNFFTTRTALFKMARRQFEFRWPKKKFEKKEKSQLKTKTNFSSKRIFLFRFRKLQIIRKKHGQFSYQLIPYHPFFPDLPAERCNLNNFVWKSMLKWIFL